jgi:acyl-coenzyme A synthetase/AMP-(fatty) acid ligase
MAHPKIQDVAVIGLPSLRLGEIATAIIKVKQGHVLPKRMWKHSAWTCPATSVPGK